MTSSRLASGNGESGSRAIPGAGSWTSCAAGSARAHAFSTSVAGTGSRRRFSERFDVVGVDLSEEQLQLARAEVPGATFVQADFADLDFPAESFDAVAALYSFVHVPR